MLSTFIKLPFVIKIYFRVAVLHRFYCTSLLPNFYPVNMLHSICKPESSIRVENGVADQMA